MNLRGKFCTDAAGRIAFRSVKPVGYAIPTRGVVGELLRALGRAPMRPAHIHFMIHKPGFKTQFSQVYASDDPQLQDDVQFAVTQALVGQYVLHDGEPAPAAGRQRPVVFAGPPLRHRSRRVPAARAAAREPVQGVMTTSTLQGATSIRLFDTEPRHQRSAQLSRCLWPTTMRSAAHRLRHAHDLVDRDAGDDLAAHVQPGRAQARHALVQHRLVARLLLAVAGRAVGPGLAGDQRHRRRHHRHQVQLRLAPLADLLAVEQRALPRFGAVIGQHDGLVHGRCPPPARHDDTPDFAGSQCGAARCNAPPAITRRGRLLQCAPFDPPPPCSRTH